MKSLFLTFLISILLPSMAFSQDKQSQMLDFPVATELLFKNNTNLKLTLSQIDSLRIQVREAYTNAYPTLTASALSSRVPEEVGFNLNGQDVIVQSETNKTLSLHFEQPLFQFRVSPLVKGAHLQTQAEVERYRNTSEYMLQTLALSFYEILGVQNSITIITNSIARIEEHLNHVQARFEEGLLPETTLLEAQLNLESAILEKKELKALLSNHLQQLSLILKTTKPNLVSPPPNSNLDISWTYKKSIDRAQENNKSFSEISKRIRSYEYGISSVKREYFPSLNFFYDYQRNLETTAFSPDESTWVAGLTLNWSIFEKGAKNIRLLQLKNLIKSQTLLREQLEETLQLNLNRLYSELEVIEQRTNTLKKQKLLSKKLFSLRKIQFESGLTTQLELLEGETALKNTEIALNNQIIAKEIAKVKIKYEEGLLSEYLEVNIPSVPEKFKPPFVKVYENIFLRKFLQEESSSETQ